MTKWYYYLGSLQRNQGLGFVAALTLMTGIVVWVFFLIQLYRIGRNETANESFKRDDLYETATMDGASSGRHMFRFLMKRLTRKQKREMPRREQKKALDASWGGLFSPDAILNTEEEFSAADVKYNPYDQGSFWKNLLDATGHYSPETTATTAKKTD